MLTGEAGLVEIRQSKGEPEENQRTYQRTNQGDGPELEE